MAPVRLAGDGHTRGQGAPGHRLAPPPAQRFCSVRVTRAILPPSVASVLATARTFTLDGISARPVRVEVDVHRGLPDFTIVGLPDAAVREARERVRAALVNCGFEFPLRRIVVNLAPASLRKAGRGWTWRSPLALLSASGQLEWEGLAARGAGRRAGARRLDPAGATGRWRWPRRRGRAGRRRSCCRPRTAAEAALAEGIDVIGVDALGRSAGVWSPGSGSRPGPRPLPLQLDPRRAPRPRRPARPAAPAARARGRRSGRAQPADDRPSRCRQVVGGESPALDPAAAGRGRGAGGGADRQRLRPPRRRRRQRPPVPGAAPHDQRRRAWSAAARRRGRARRPSPTAASSSSTSSASSGATPWRRCGRRWRRARSRSPGPAAAAVFPAGSCWSPPPTPAPAGAAKRTRTAPARRLRCSATRAS